MEGFFPKVTWFIFFLNISIFILSFQNPGELLLSFLSLDSVPQEILLEYGLYPDLVVDKPYTLVTHMFIHRNSLHLIINMLVLVGIGSLLENKIGSLNLFLSYFFSGFIVVLFNLLLAFALNSPNVGSIGASGAIFGLLALSAILLSEEKVPIIFVPIANLLGVLYLFGFNPKVNLILAMIFYIIFLFVLIVLGVYSVSELAHFGGIFGGLVYFWIFKMEKNI